MINLSVNVNKVATLRNARGGHEPNVVQAARTCIEAGCQGIIVHPREDQRHIQPGDVYDLNIDNLHRLRDLPGIKEVSISHALIYHTLYVGLAQAVKDFRRAYMQEI